MAVSSKNMSADIAAKLFYDRLFETTPEVRPLFRGDMAEQGRKLMQMLAVAVAGLRRFDELLPAVEDMGRRHADLAAAALYRGAAGDL